MDTRWSRGTRITQSMRIATPRNAKNASMVARIAFMEVHFHAAWLFECISMQHGFLSAWHCATNCILGHSTLCAARSALMHADGPPRRIAHGWKTSSGAKMHLHCMGNAIYHVIKRNNGGNAIRCVCAQKKHRRDGPRGAAMARYGLYYRLRTFSAWGANPYK